MTFLAPDVHTHSSLRYLKLFFFLSVHPQLQKIPAKKVLRHDLFYSEAVSQGSSEVPTAHFFLLMFSPKKELNDPVKGLSLDEIERNVISMSFNDGWGMKKVDIMDLPSINLHNFESFWLLSKGLYS